MIHEYPRRIAARLQREVRIRRHQVTDPAVFIWIPKVAGSSIYRALRPYGCRRLNTLGTIEKDFESRGCVTFGHIDYHALIANGMVSTAFANEAFRFSFVRNPFDRAVSLWAYLRRFDLFDEQLPFEAFVDLIEEGVTPIGLYNTSGLSQANPQMEWLTQPHGASLDFVGRYETIQSDFRKVCQRLDIPDIKLAHHNQSDRSDYRSYFNHRTRRVVEQIYAPDFEAFDYSF